MDSTISKIVNRALDGAVLSDAEIATLFKVEDSSEEAFAIRHAGRLFSSELLGGKAEVHGQIGINVSACPRGCQFCSFAAENKVFGERSELAVEDIIAGVHSFEEKGANAVFIMETATYPIEKFLEVSKAVKAAMKTDIPMIANMDDFDDDIAKELVASGYTGVYHVIRMGEGEFTRIPVARRWKTIEAAHNAGLILGSCVEPIGPEHTIEELVEKTVFTREMKAVFSGAMRRTTIPSSPLAKHGMLTFARLSTIVAVVALATSTSVPGNCTHEPSQLGVYNGANLVWAEVGANPRDTAAETSEGRGWTVDRCKELFEECDWEVLEGPSQMIMQAVK